MLKMTAAPVARAQAEDDHDVVPLSSGRLIQKQVPIPTMMVRPSFAPIWGKSQVGTIENLVGAENSPGL